MNDDQDHLDSPAYERKELVHHNDLEAISLD